MKHEYEQYGHLPIFLEQLKYRNDPYPYLVEIHPTDICNHRCDYCFHGGIGFNKSRNDEILDLAKYESLFREMAGLGINRLSISGGGDPFIDQRLKDILIMANAESLEVRIVTHGNLLNEDLTDVVLDCCKEIRFSIDAINAETYVKIRRVPGRLLNMTLDNLARLIIRKNARRSPLKVGTTFLLNEHNFREVESFCLCMLTMGVDAAIIKNDIYNIHTIPHTELAAVKLCLAQIHDSRLEIREKMNLPICGQPCFVPYFKATFNPYGELYSCSLGSQPGEKNGYLLGNLHHQTLCQIWESSRQLRTLMRTEGVTCTDCNHTDSYLNSLVAIASVSTPSDPQAN